MITWTKEFETGSAELDQQHRLLIDHINLLEDNLQTTLQPTNPRMAELEFMVHLVDYLEAYAHLHFECEEKCMARSRCPAHAENKQQHERCRGFIRDFRSRFETEGFKVELFRTLHDAMHSWITDHILKIDTQLKPCIQA